MTDTHTTAHIPDEAVQAMPERIYASAPSSKGCVVSFDIPSLAYDIEYIRADIAVTHLSAPCAVEVKKLEWQEPTKETNGCWTAKCPIGTYSVVNENGWYAVLDEHAWGVAGFEWSSTDISKDTRQTAFNAAQADFERRVLSCVVTKPVDVPALLQEVRSGERDGFINTGKEPHGNDADLSCPCCGGSGHKDDAKPVDVAAVRTDLDSRLKAAGMYTVEEIMAGTPVDKWRVHSGMDNLQFFGDWLERKAREYKVMTAGYDIGDKDKSDELYEWSLAHSGAFHDVLVNFRAAIRALSAEPAQGEQWKSIETAPKDTTEIIVLCGQKDIRLGWYFAPSSQTFGWFDQRQKKINPTHWMPLPAAPTTEAGK